MTTYLNFSEQTLCKVSTLVELLCQRAQNQPNKTAYTFLENGEAEVDSLTYQKLDQQARAIATSIQSLVAPGERALLLYPSGLEFIAAFFGCLYAGVVPVPAYPPRRNQNIHRLQAIVRDAQAKVVLTTTPMMANIKGQLVENPDLMSMHWLSTDNITSDLAQAWQEPALCENTLAFLQYTSGSTSSPKGVMVTHANLLHNLALIHQAFGHTPNSYGVIWLPPYHDMGLIGGVLQPLYGGFPVTLMSPFAFLQKPLRWLSAISDYKATTSGGPNFAYDLCVSKITPSERASLDLSSWEVAFNGAETVRAETLERFTATFASCGFRREAFYPCYGMAETTLLVSGGSKTSPPVSQRVNTKALEQNQVVVAQSQNQKSHVLVGCGKTFADQKVIIVNPETNLECPPYQVGEIWVAGASVANGYWRRPEETKHTFQAYLKDTGAGPFLRTGDLGFLQDGELFVTGRLKDVIIIRGRNHYPQDIELTIERSHPALRPGCAAAFTVEVNGQERLVVVQEVERSYLRHLDVHEVVKTIRQAVSLEHDLQVYAVELLTTGSIPKTSSGKIQRHACRNGFLSKSLNAVGDWTANPEVDLLELVTEVEALYEQLQNSEHEQSLKGLNKPFSENISHNTVLTQETIETWLVTHLALYLKVPPNEIDIKQPFAVYGLDSSVAITMTGELGQWLGCELEPTLFWEYPNIQALAQYLEAEHRPSRQLSFTSV